MKQEQLKKILQDKYDTAQWLQVLMFIAQHKNTLTLFAEPKEIKLASKREESICTEILQLGHIKTTDGETMPVFEIALQPKIKIEHNKVAVNELVKNHIVKDAVNAALVTFYSPDADKKEWRFSFVSKSSANEYFSEIADSKETNPRKYTYIFGTKETHRTAIDRLYALHQSSLELNDFFEAFNVEPVSKKFFTEYKKFFLEFVDELKDNYYNIFIVKDEETNKEDKEKTETEIRNFVKRLLGRIVFLYFLQKKNWLGASDRKYKDGDPDFLQSLFEYTKNKENFYSETLSNLFFNALNKIRDNDIYSLPDGSKKCIPFLNGGLFEEEHEPKEHKQIKFSAYRFEDLFNFFNSYNFTIYENSPEEHTVAVDPEMLGHIFENLLEDNKDKGAFYTPKEIVHYMTQQSLVEYLKTHTSIERDKLETLIKNNICEGFTAKELEQIDALIDKVKICDPAIGSGAFPMGLLQEIFALKAQIHYELQRKDWNPAKVKQNIIQNSIYGVDIEPGAVDIARLRFWLSLVVDEELPQPLPNLDYKIMQGDSLVESYDHIDLSNLGEENEAIVSSQGILNFGEDYKEITVFDSISMENIQHLIKKYFTTAKEKTQIKKQINEIIEEKIQAKIYSDKQLLKAKIERFYRKHNLNNNAELDGFNLKSKEIKELIKDKERLSQLDKIEKELIIFQYKTERPYFLWKIFFKDVFDEGGFDIVIGNPPYIQLQKGSGKLSQILEKLNYETFTRTGDIYSIFYEKGWQILKEKGVLCYITSNKWMRAGYGELTRKFFAEKTNPLILIDFAGQKIFESATVDTNILLFSKDKNRQQTRACIVKEKVLNNLSDYFRQNATNCHFSNSESWVILSEIEQRIKAKIEAIGTPLKNWDINIYRGILTGYNDAFIIDGKKKDELIAEDPKSAEIIRPILRGRDIKKYGYDFANLWLINTHNGIKEKGIKPVNINDYPAIKKHLDTFYPELEKRADKGETPYNLRNCAYMEDFFRPKIVYIEIMTDNPDEGYDFPCFSFDTQNSVALNTAYIMTGEIQELRYILGILNSKLGKQLVKYYVVQLQQRQFRMLNQYVVNFPIPKANKNDYDYLSERVEKILQNKKNKEDTSILEKEIEDKVHILFNLTQEEIEFIEVR